MIVTTEMLGENYYNKQGKYVFAYRNVMSYAERHNILCGLFSNLLIFFGRIFRFRVSIWAIG